ncbi:MAG: hypothetical protein H6734_02640 [Alphaproteobacteria bacterium]|nr:hypothetical protein [Alphaproteobacteria bacterium]
MKITLDPRASVLLAPVREILDTGASLLPEGSPLHVTVGPTGGYSTRRGDVLVLSNALEGPGISHPDEPEDGLPPLDRWRRAAGEILEEAAVSCIEAAVDTHRVEDWRWVGLAMEMVDTVAPALEWGLPGVLRAIQSGAPGLEPRCGVAAMKAWRARGVDPWHRVRDLIDGGVVSPQEWLEVGRWVMDPAGAAALLPIPVERVGVLDIPCAIDAWRWQPLQVPPHRRGGLIEVIGPGTLGDPWAVANLPHRTLAASTGGVVELRPLSGGPTGRWVVTSAEGFGQVMGARGVSMELDSAGRIQLTFADAFVGPLAAVRMAEEVGTSGITRGRWSVAAPHRLKFEGLDDSQLTVHGRTASSYRLPSRGFGIGAWIQAMTDSPWAWQQTGERLVLRGQMLRGWVDVRLKREGT